MSTLHSPADKASDRRNGPRPRYYLVGIDSEGAHHVHRTTDDRILVIEAGRITHKFSIDPWDPDARTVDDYKAWVRDDVDGREWRECYYQTSEEAYL